MRSRRITAAVLAGLLTLTLAACGSDGGSEGAEPTTTTEAPTTTTTEDPVADVTGDWTMTLSVVETVPAGVELPPESAVKDRDLGLQPGECPAPADLVYTGDAGPGGVEGSAGQATGECVGAATIGVRSGEFENLPLLATEDGFTVALRVDSLCIDANTGAADPASAFVTELEYRFSVVEEDSTGAPTRLEGDAVETHAAESTCPSSTGADVATFDLVAVPG